MIEIHDLNFHYPKGRGLEITQQTFEDGKVYGIIGKNGAGKTTLFKILTNMLVNYTGKVKVDGIDIKSEPSALAKVSIILDDLEVYKAHSGWFNLEYFSRLRGGFDREAASVLADKLGIIENLNEKTKGYSLGMRRKLIMMIALLNDSSTYIFDEPFRGLDTDTVKWMKQYFLELKKQGKTILISSHVKDDIDSLIDEAVVIVEGKISRQIDLETLSTSLRKIRLKSDADFPQFLASNGVSFESEEGMYTLNIEDEQWKQILPKLLEHGFEIEEMKKVSALETIGKEEEEDESH